MVRGRASRPGLFGGRLADFFKRFGTYKRSLVTSSCIKLTQFLEVFAHRHNGRIHQRRGRTEHSIIFAGFGKHNQTRRLSRRNENLRKLCEQYKLTPREREVVTLLTEGLTSKEIAQKMNISAHTVKGFVHLIMVKLGVTTRSGIVGRLNIR